MQTTGASIAERFEKLLLSSRLIVYIAVAGSLLASLTCMIVGGIVTVRVMLSALTPLDFSTEVSKLLAVDLVEVIDLFLLGTVLYIVATGLYAIFINPKIAQLSWMEVYTLDALKGKIIGVVIVLLAVTFLGQVVQWKGGTDILMLGGAIGFVLAALAILLNFGSNRPSDHPLK